MRRLAIFAHFDAQNDVKRFVYHHLEGLRSVCASTLFISTSPVDAANRRKLETSCERVLVVENAGFDFSMWQRGLGTVPLAEWDELVLTNSSVFGPVFPLRETFSRMDGAPADFWGVTENTEFARHVQSYFLVFRRTALEAEAFQRFWNSVLPYRNKFQTIRSYEIGLTTFLVEQGLSYSTLVKNEDLQPRWPRQQVYDLTLSRPAQLLTARAPYVKAGLLRDNPKRINLKPIYRQLAAAGYDRSLIEFDRSRNVFEVDPLR